MSVSIYLYTPAPASLELVPPDFSLRRRVRNRIRRLADFVAWYLFGSWRFHYSSYARTGYANQGDVAVRLAVTQQLTAAFAGRELSITEVAWGALGDGLLQEINSGADLFVIAGAGYINVGDDGEISPRNTRDVQHLQQLTCPIVAYAIGANKNIYREADPAEASFGAAAAATMARFVGTLRLLSVRDGYTRSALASVSGCAPDVVADPALFLWPRDRDLPVTIERSPLPLGAGLTIGINLAFHSQEYTRLLQHSLPLLVGLARHLAQRYRCDFHYFCHFDSESLAVDLLRWSGVTIKAVIRQPPQGLLLAYANMDLVVGQMLHSSILACAASVPVFNLAYDVKNRAFWELMGLEENSRSAYSLSPEDLISNVERVIGDRVAIRARMTERKAALRADRDAWLAKLVDLVEGERGPTGN